MIQKGFLDLSHSWSRLGRSPSSARDPAPSLFRPKCGSAIAFADDDADDCCCCCCCPLAALAQHETPSPFSAGFTPVDGLNSTLLETLRGVTIAGNGVNCISPLAPAIGQQSARTEKHGATAVRGELHAIAHRLGLLFC